MGGVDKCTSYICSISVQNMLTGHWNRKISVHKTLNLYIIMYVYVYIIAPKRRKIYAM